MDFWILAGGLGLLLLSAKYFVDGIAFFCEAFGVSPLVVGMTVVAFGTSTPELVVNVLSATRGETALAFGNIVGASVLNVGVVLAAVAVVRPLSVEPSLITREIPMLLVAVFATVVLGNDRLLGGSPVDEFGRGDGLILLLLFGIFVYYTVIYSVARRALGIRDQDAFLAEVEATHEPVSRDGWTTKALVTLAGLAGVSVGADWTVDGATGLARLVGIPEAIIGLTVVSLGTTLPELVTSITAARRGNPDIALGNVVGSNLFNLLAVAGIVSVVRPVEIPPGGQGDLALLALLSCALLPVAIRSGRTITRREGMLFLATYAAYAVYRLSASASS